MAGRLPFFNRNRKGIKRTALVNPLSYPFCTTYYYIGAVIFVDGGGNIDNGFQGVSASTDITLVSALGTLVQHL